MRLHRNAKTTPYVRELLVDRVLRQGWAMKDAASAAGISVRTAYKWLARFRAQGLAGLEDRSSRPRRSPLQTPHGVVERIEKLRRRKRTAWEIAHALRVPPSTVSRILRRLGLGKLWRVEARERPAQRYEHDRPGSLVHLDAKSPGPHRYRRSPHPRRPAPPRPGRGLGGDLRVRR